MKDEQDITGNYPATDIAQTRELVNRITAFRDDAEGDCKKDRRLSGLIQAYLPGLAHAAEHYGDRSRAAYLIKYMFTGMSFNLYVQRHMLPGASGAPAVKKLFEMLSEDLNAHFLELINWDSIDNGRRRRVNTLIEGVRRSVYVYDKQMYVDELKAHEDLVKPYVLSVTQARATKVRGDACYLYCVTESGELRIFNRPIAPEELIVGVRHDGVLIKHPLILLGNGLSVLCAGDLWICKDRNDHIAGLLASRASGQFRPDADALEALTDVGRSLQLDEAHVRTIGWQS